MAVLQTDLRHPLARIDVLCTSLFLFDIWMNTRVAFVGEWPLTCWSCLPNSIGYLQTICRQLVLFNLACGCLTCTRMYPELYNFCQFMGLSCWCCCRG